MCIRDRYGVPRGQGNRAWLARQKKRLGRKFDSYWYSSEKKDWIKHPGWPLDAEEWKKLQAWVVRRSFSKAAAVRPNFVDEIAKVFRDVFPVYAFTGDVYKRQEEITPERRMRQRYTLSHLAKDVSNQVGKIEPTRDWFPISLVSAFAGYSDLVHGPDSQWGSLSCGCHPNCGVGTAVMINKETKEWAPVPRFLNTPQLVKDVNSITDAARGKNFSNFMMAMALLKNCLLYTSRCV